MVGAYWGRCAVVVLIGPQATVQLPLLADSEFEYLGEEYWF